MRSRTERSICASRPARRTRPAARQYAAMRCSPSGAFTPRPARSKALFEPPFDGFERLGKLVRIDTAGLGHVRTSAALATDLLGDEVDEVAGLHLGDEVLGDAGHERNLAVVHRREKGHAAAHPVLHL